MLAVGQDKRSDAMDDQLLDCLKHYRLFRPAVCNIECFEMLSVGRDKRSVPGAMLWMTSC